MRRATKMKIEERTEATEKRVTAAGPLATRNVTQMRSARQGEVTWEMCRVAEREVLEPQLVRDEVAAGRAVIPANICHPELDPVGIGKAFRVKINANIGNSPLASSLDEELEKRQEFAARRHGFEIERHSLKLFGTCQSCRERKQEESGEA